MPDSGIRQHKNDTSEILHADDILALAASVFAGFDTEELAEVEAAMRRRPDFFGENVENWPAQTDL